MKITTIIALTFISLISVITNESQSININNPTTEEININKNSDDWNRIGVTEIQKKVGRNVPATQKVQVYQNSDGTRAIKDKYGYQEIRENSMYKRYPDEECFECRYSHKVSYNGETWYTHNIVKQN